MNVLDLFSGIGGFSLGLEWASPEFKTIAFCEIDPYAQKVLKKHWPEVPIYGDISKINNVDVDKLVGVDLLCAGFPCQDISVAGKQKGLKDEKGNQTRSGLFFEIIRIAELCKPRWIVLENVAALLSRPEWIGAIFGSLAEIGYDAEWEIIRASDMGAPHKRARIWIVAYPRYLCGGNNEYRNERLCGNTQTKKTERSTPQPKTTRPSKKLEDVANSQKRTMRNDSDNKREADRKIDPFDNTSNACREREKPNIGCIVGWDNDPSEWPIESRVGRVAHGIPSRVDRLKCLGNAIVPQIAELIGKKILEAESCMKRES